MCYGRVLVVISGSFRRGLKSLPARWTVQPSATVSSVGCQSRPSGPKSYARFEVRSLWTVVFRILGRFYVLLVGDVVRGWMGEDRRWDHSLLSCEPSVRVQDSGGKARSDGFWVCVLEAYIYSLTSEGKRGRTTWRAPVAGWRALRHEATGGKARRIPLDIPRRRLTALSLLAHPGFPS